MNNVERFSYGDFVKPNQKMVYYKSYVKQVTGDKWTPEHTMTVNIPVYPHSIKILEYSFRTKEGGSFASSLMGRGEIEIFLVTTDGELVDIPESQTLEKGKVIKVRNIERVVFLNKEQAKKVKENIQDIRKKNISLVKKRRLIAEMWLNAKKDQRLCLEEMEGTCQTIYDVSSFLKDKEFAYWYADITDDEVVKRGKEAIEYAAEVMQKRMDDIDNKISEIVSKLINGLSWLESKGIVENVDLPAKEKQECELLKARIEELLIPKREIKNVVLEYEQEDRDLKQLACEIIQRKVTDFITINRDRLSAQVVEYGKTLFCNWSKSC